MEQFDWLQNDFHLPAFALQPNLVWWRISSIDETRDMATNMATIFARGVLWRLSFLGNLKPSDKKLDLHKTPPLDFSSSFLLLFPSRLPHQPLPQNNFTLDWNSRPTDTLLRHILNRLLVSKIRARETIASSIQVLCHRAYLIAHLQHIVTISLVLQLKSCRLPCA